MAANEIRTFSITINGETREVMAKDVWGDEKAFDSCDEDGKYAMPVLARFRTGTKLWPSNLRFWRRPDGSYRANLTDTHLNRTTSIVAWNDEKWAKKLSRRSG